MVHQGRRVDATTDNPDASIKAHAERLIAVRPRKTSYVVIFADHDFMDKALNRNAALVDWAFERRVLLAAPANLREILATVAAVWNRAEGVIHVDGN